MPDDATRLPRKEQVRQAAEAFARAMDPHVDLEGLSLLELLHRVDWLLQREIDAAQADGEVTSPNTGERVEIRYDPERADILKPHGLTPRDPNPPLRLLRDEDPE